MKKPRERHAKSPAPLKPSSKKNLEIERVLVPVLAVKTSLANAINSAEGVLAKHGVSRSAKDGVLAASRSIPPEDWGKALMASEVIEFAQELQKGAQKARPEVDILEVYRLGRLVGKAEGVSPDDCPPVAKENADTGDNCAYYARELEAEFYKNPLASYNALLESVSEKVKEAKTKIGNIVLEDPQGKLLRLYLKIRELAFRQIEYGKKEKTPSMEDICKALTDESPDMWKGYIKKGQIDPVVLPRLLPFARENILALKVEAARITAEANKKEIKPDVAKSKRNSAIGIEKKRLRLESLFNPVLESNNKPSKAIAMIRAKAHLLDVQKLCRSGKAESLYDVIRLASKKIRRPPEHVISILSDLRDKWIKNLVFDRNPELDNLFNEVSWNTFLRSHLAAYSRMYSLIPKKHPKGGKQYSTYIGLVKALKRDFDPEQVWDMIQEAGNIICSLPSWNRNKTLPMPGDKTTIEMYSCFSNSDYETIREFFKMNEAKRR